MCRPLLRTNYNSFAAQCVKKNETTRAAIVKVIGQLLQSEVATICSDNFQSILRLKTTDSVKNFNHIVSTIIGEMEKIAPTLLSLLKSCLKTKKPRPNTDVFLAVILSIVCKNRRPAACIIQRIVSLILYAGHSSKQVSDCSTARCSILKENISLHNAGLLTVTESWSLCITLDYNYAG